MMARSCLAAALVVVLSCGSAFAQSREFADGVGVGAGVTRDHMDPTGYGPESLSYAARDWQGSHADPRSARPVLRLRSDRAPSITFQAGALLNEQQGGGHPDTVRADAMNRGDGGIGVGGFAGVLLNDDEMSGTAIGLNFQGMAGDSAAGDGMLFELGADYTTPVADSLQFSARVSSSFSAENAMGPVVGGNGLARSGLDKSDTNGGFKDVGLGLGLDYNFAESWNLETNLGYTRLIGDTRRRSLADDDASSHQVFGGVVVNYRF
jgi:outer membrane scaffolding protein for murein synthesis (MipA/OmpV family)